MFLSYKIFGFENISFNFVALIHDKYLVSTTGKSSYSFDLYSIKQ